MGTRDSLQALAPAKINLTLHVTGRRPGGYHDLDSLVVFAGIGDTISVRASDTLDLTVTGPFSDGVPCDGRNLILQAAEALLKAHSTRHGAAITLEKALPHAAGIGSGSSDAATSLDLLSRHWDLPPPALTDPMAMALGADVPVCMAQPRPMRMRGIGERLSYVPALPSAALVLINPRVPVPTGAVFKAMTSTENPPMDDVPEGLDLAGFASWLARQRNDMTDAAIGIAPEIGKAIDRLERQQLVQWAGMSGSGATCVGLVQDMDHARRVARAVQVAEMGWWVAPAPLLAG